MSLDPEVLGGYAFRTDKGRLGGEPKPCEPFRIELCISGQGPVKPQDLLGENFTKRLQIGGQHGPDAYGAAAGLEYTVILVEGEILPPGGGRIFIIVEMAEILEALGLGWQPGKWYGRALLNVATVPQSICCTVANKLSWQKTGLTRDDLVFEIGGSGGTQGLQIAQADETMTTLKQRYLAPKKLAYSCAMG